MQIGERIKNRRNELGISVDELAVCIDKNRATIYRYEKGDIENLPVAVLEPLAKALHTTPAYLMGWTENPDDDAIPNHKKETPLSSPTDTDVERYFRKSTGNLKTNHYIEENELAEIREREERAKYLTPVPVLASISRERLDLTPYNATEYIDLANEIILYNFSGDHFAMYAKDDSLSSLGIEKGDLMFFDTDDDPDPDDMNGRTVLVSTNIIKEPFIRRLTCQSNGLVILDTKGSSLPMSFSYRNFLDEVKIIARLVFNVKRSK